MSVANMNAVTAATIRSNNPNAVRIGFSELLKRSKGNTGDVFKRFEGPDGALGFPISRFSDLKKVSGETIQWTKHGGLKGKPILGDDALRGNEEPIKFGTHSARIGFVRNGSSWTREQLRIMAVGKSVPEVIADELDKWLGGIRTDFIMQRWLQRMVGGHNIYYPNNRGSIGALTASDVISPNVIEYAHSRLSTIGAQPIRNATAKSGAAIQQYLFFAPNDVLLPLYSNDDYVNRNIHSENRGEQNTISEGGFSTWRGDTIFNWNQVDDDSNGAIGSFFNAKAKLGEAISAGTGSVTIKGGGAGMTSGPDYFRYFAGNIAFLQYKGESISADTTVYYLKIWNHTGAAAGKWGMYSYTGSTDNLGTTIATTERLGSAASGTRVTTLGSVTWNSAVNSDAHPVGAPIYQCNAKGEVIGYVGALGTGAALIGYGGGAMGDPSTAINGSTNYRGKSMSLEGSMGFTDTEDYGMRVGAAIEAVMGVDVSKDTGGLPCSFVIIPVVYNPPEIGG